MEAFTRAAQEGDVERLLALLDPDVTFTADGGGAAIAARKPLRGALRVARAWVAIRRRSAVTAQSIVEVNGAAGLLIEHAGGGRTLLAFTVDGGRIVRVDVVRNPAKLRHV